MPDSSVYATAHQKIPFRYTGVKIEQCYENFQKF